MDKWNTVRWTEARQIAEAMDSDPATLPEEGVDPRSYYLGLKSGGQLDRALAYLGHALPRYEAVAWAAHAIRTMPSKEEPLPLDRQALDRTMQWIEDPGDDYRRAAYQAAESAGRESPERLVAIAAYMSGGSIAPPDLPPVNPPQEVCGRIAAAAVLVAAHRSGDAASALAAALEAGEKIAARGVEALATR
jgi:hypothetical protein